MRDRRPRRISAGTWVVLFLSIATLGLCAVTLPRLMGSGHDVTINPRLLLDALVDLQLPSMPGQQQPIAFQAEAQPDATDVPTVVPAPTAGPRQLSICAVGSVFGAKDIRQSGYDKESKTYHFEDIFGEVRPYLSEADLAICTAETIFGGEEIGYSDYNMPDEMLDALRASGMDMISLASESTLTRGIDGLNNTIQALESRGMMITGIDPQIANRGASSIFQINDIQISVLGYTETLSNDSKNRVKAADRAIIPMMDIERIKADITDARKNGADLVIVMPHWGTKNSAKISADQRKWAEQLTAAGADIVLGAHPNVVQRIERQTVQQANGGMRDTLVAFSLGSFLTNVRDTANAASIVLRIELQMDPATRKLTIVSCTYTPIWVSRLHADTGSAYTYRILRSDDSDSLKGLDANATESIHQAVDFIQKTLQDSAVTPAL